MCTERRSGDSLLLESHPTFAPPTSVTLAMMAGKPVKAKSGDFSFSYSPDLASANGKSGAPTVKPLYSPTPPGLLPYVLSGYDRAKGGFQALQATDLATHKLRTLNVELFATPTIHHQKMHEWRMESSPSPEAIIWTDEQEQPLYWWVPARDYEVVCRGYEFLRPSTKYEGRVSPPRFEVAVDRDVRIPMRDGVHLGADVYRPVTPGRYPVILQRTCYDRSEFGNRDGQFFAQRGFVYVTQHVRGRGTSEGKFEPEQNEARDGYDTVAWCGSQTWSAGKVGMLGASYNAFCLWMAAKTHPKWLRTMISVVPMPGAPYGEPWDGGAFYVGAELSWFGLLRDKAKVQAYDDDLTDATNALPISRADTVQFGHAVPQFQARIHADRFDASVAQCSYDEGLKTIDMPVLYFDGWLDTVAVGTRRNYSALKSRGVKNQKLIWGPWDHFTNQESRVDVTDATPAGYVDMRTIELRWFDRWLKGIRNGIDKEPSVDQFILGENKWYRAGVWPPKSLQSQRWYLHASGGLSNRAPSREAPSFYVYDPAKWVATKDQNSGFFFAKGSVATDLCKHSGQLIFDSQPLKKPLTLDGPIRARVYAATDAKDTDWAMTLLDLHPDGTAVAIQSGFVRARYRNSVRRPELLKGGEVVGYDLDLWETGMRIPEGHRLRVVVSSTLFPDMDRNLNTGERVADATRIVAAHQRIYHDRLHASYIELPALSRGSV